MSERIRTVSVNSLTKKAKKKAVLQASKAGGVWPTPTNDHPVELTVFNYPVKATGLELSIHIDLQEELAGLTGRPAYLAVVGGKVYLLAETKHLKKEFVLTETGKLKRL